MNTDTDTTIFYLLGKPFAKFKFGNLYVEDNTHCLNVEEQRRFSDWIKYNQSIWQKVSQPSVISPWKPLNEHSQFRQIGNKIEVKSTSGEVDASLLPGGPWSFKSVYVTGLPGFDYRYFMIFELAEKPKPTIESLQAQIDKLEKTVEMGRCSPYSPSVYWHNTCPTKATVRIESECGFSLANLHQVLSNSGYSVEFHENDPYKTMKIEPKK